MLYIINITKTIPATPFIYSTITSITAITAITSIPAITAIASIPAITQQPYNLHPKKF